VALQALPPAAEPYARSQRAEMGAAVAAVRRLWSRMGEDFDASWAQIERQLLLTLDTAQERITAGALEYVPEVLAQTSRTVRRAEYAVDPAALVGTTGAGFGTDEMAYGAVLRAKSLAGEGADWRGALAGAGAWLTAAAGTLLSDTGRTAERMAGNARGPVRYVRMLTPPSCGRCVILAGRTTGEATAFDRHPGCDCHNIPAAEAIADDLTVNAAEYLGSLDEEGLRKALGSRANAQAYIDGADVNQLINAYRASGGVRSAQVFDRTVKYSTEGVTRRGIAYRRMSQARSVRDQGTERAGRYRSLRAPRLMPESIYAIAIDRADALRLLRLYGWVL